jgi:heptosyltransferase-2
VSRPAPGALEPGRTLLVRGLNWLGDAVMGLPALGALARAGIPMTILTRAATAALYESLSPAGGVVIEERGLAGRLRTLRRLKAGAHGGALLLPNSLSSALTALAALIPNRTGYARDGRRPLLTRAVQARPVDLAAHQSFYFLRLVEAMGLPAPFARPALTPEALDPSLSLPEGLKLAVAPGAAYGGAKRWPASEFAAAARLILTDRPGTAVILGGAAERATCDEVEDRLARGRGPAILNLAGRTTLAQAMAVLARCHLTISNDSGLSHLSGALDVPVVAVFGPTDPLTTSPLSRRLAVLRKPAPCSPCLRRECPKSRRVCLEGITAEMAADAADKLLSPIRTGAGAVFWTPTAEESWPSGPLPPKTRLVAARSDLERAEPGVDPESAPPGTLLLPRPLRESRDWPAVLKDNRISLRDSFWLGDTVESLRPAASLGGRAVLIMTAGALSNLTAFRELDPGPDLAAPDSGRALEWMASLEP